jgi:hypothetical protein
MLSEFEAIVGKATSNSMQAALEADLRSTARALIERQFIFAEDFHGARRFETIKKNKRYFSDLFDAMGFDLVLNEREQMVGLTSQEGVAQRRMSINETLFLLSVRVIYEERVRDFLLGEGGRAKSSMAELWGIIEERAGRSRPTATQCRRIAEGLAKNGLIKLAETLPDGDTAIEIRPSIIRAVTAATVEDLERYQMTGLRDDGDVGIPDQTRGQETDLEAVE